MVYLYLVILVIATNAYSFYRGALYGIGRLHDKIDAFVAWLNGKLS